MEIGLKEHEARVYLALLSRGVATVLQISRESGVKRTTVYSVLDSLKSLGVIHTERTPSKTRYRAEAPDVLERLLERRRVAFRQSLPELEALYNMSGESSHFSFYEGLPAIKNVYANLLQEHKRGDEYRVMTDVDTWKNLDEAFFTAFLEKRAKKGVRVRSLFVPSAAGQYIAEHADNYLQTVRLLPKGTELSMNMIITEDKVVMHQLVEPVFAVITKNASIVSLHRQVFDMLWAKTKTRR